jgi:hypothetical protein
MVRESKERVVQREKAGASAGASRDQESAKRREPRYLGPELEFVWAAPMPPEVHAKGKGASGRTAMRE